MQNFPRSWASLHLIFLVWHMERITLHIALRRSGRITSGNKIVSREGKDKKDRKLLY